MIDIKLTSKEDTITIEELYNNEDYFPEEVYNFGVANKFKFTDTIAIDVLSSNSARVRSLDTIYTCRKDNNKDKKITFSSTKDGWFTVYHIVIPTKKWFEENYLEADTLSFKYNVVYYADNHILYKYENDIISIVKIDELLDNNCTNSTITRVKKEYFNISNLITNLANLYKEIFKKRLFYGNCNLKVCDANRLRASRDLILHHVKYEEYAEAQRVLEKTMFVREGNNKLVTRDNSKKSICGCI